MNILNASQAGFRKKYSAVDNMFVLHSLLNILKSKKKSVFCDFIDLKVTFDSVWRNGLWYKLSFLYNLKEKKSYQEYVFVY